MVYRATNESLKAIVTGLDVSSGDHLLVIGGSGDQAFALLEFAGKVTAVDNNPEQVDFMRQKYEALERRDYESFFNSGIESSESLVGLRNDSNSFLYDILVRSDERRKNEKRSYFQEANNRLDRVRANLHNLVIAEPENIFKVAQQEKGHSKIYLSNAIGYSQKLDPTYLIDILERVAQNLPINGLIYVTNHDTLFYSSFGKEPITSEQTLLSFLSKDPLVPLLPSSLTIDRELSHKARKLEIVWRPAVYRKVEPKHQN